MHRVSFSLWGDKTRVFIKKELGIIFNDYSGDKEVNDLLLKALEKRGIDGDCPVSLANSGGDISRYNVSVLKNANMDDDAFLEHIKQMQGVLGDCLIR